MDTAEKTVAFLCSRGLKLATAESCTGGLIASLVASVQGSGRCVEAGFVTYSPTCKSTILGVREETMREYGLTSEAVAREMAEGALDRGGAQANLAVANTGVADDGADDPIPAGTQCFAWSWRRDGSYATFVETVHFSGDRNEVRASAALYALSRIEHYYRVLNGECAAP